MGSASSLNDVPRLQILGASSTIAPSNDSTASLFLRTESRRVVIDAGGDLPQKLAEAGSDYRRITDVVITHSHVDHHYGLPFLSHCFYHGSRDVRLWTTAEAKPRLRDSLEAQDLLEEGRYLNVDFHVVDVDQPNDLPLAPELTVRTLPTDHSRPGFGLRLESPRQRLVYSGDTRPTRDLREAARGCDVLIHDCQATAGYRRYFSTSHTDADELGRLARDLGVGLLVPFHYNLTEFPIGWQEIARDIRRHYEGRLMKPAVGMGFFL